VFERFTQADRADSRCRGGTGLGLSICEMIIDQHDGSIAFDTEIGARTTFYFDLPDCADGGDDAVEVRTAVVG
jgi:signal transduction histidine kinase